MLEHGRNKRVMRAIRYRGFRWNGVISKGRDQPGKVLPVPRLFSSTKYLEVIRQGGLIYVFHFKMYL